MTMQRRSPVVALFEDRSLAQRAVNELKKSGFRDDQIGVAGRGHEFAASGDVPHADRNLEDSDLENSYTGEGAVAGAAAGAGIGALWGLGIMAGVMPALGPAIAGGTLAAILSSAAAGAAAAGVAGALVGMGIPREEADYYESEFKSGRTIVTVHAPGREDEAMAIMRLFGGFDASDRETRSTTTPADHMAGASFSSTANQTGKVETGRQTLDVPVQSDDVLTGRDPITDARRTSDPNE